MAYSPAVLDHFHNPRNSGSLDQPDAVGKMGVPGQGNFMVIQLRVAEGRVSELRFLTYGCPGAIACGSMVTELAKGRTLNEARSISGEDIVRELGGLPSGKGHCGGLAAGALHDAINKIALPPTDQVT